MIFKIHVHTNAVDSGLVAVDVEKPSFESVHGNSREVDE